MIPSNLTPEEFRTWRRRMGMTKKAAADRIGVSVSSIEMYEKGVRFGTETPVKIPRTVALACTAINHNLKPLGDE